MPNINGHIISVTPESILNEAGLAVMLEDIFRIVEDNYIRRTTYEADMSALSERVLMLESITNYKLSVNDEGYLTINLQSGETAPTVSIDSNGNLILDDNDTSVDKFLKQFTFNVNSDGELIATYGATS
jgi:hypothetical protein